MKKLFYFTITAVLLFTLLPSCSKSPEENTAEYIDGLLYYNNLSYEEQALYDGIKSAIEKFSPSVKTKISYTDESFSHIIYSLMYDNPQYFFVNFQNIKYINENNKIKIEIPYRHGKKQIKSMIDEFNGDLQTMSDKLKLGETGSEMEKQIRVHDYIIRTFKFDYSSSVDIYDALNTGTADPYCAAVIFKILMNKAGLECSLVTGTVQESSHIWNLVKIDGDYYFTDVVFDFFNEDFIDGTVFHAYFNLGYEKISRDHIFDKPYLFEGYNKNYTYYDYKKLSAKDETSLLNILYSQIKDRIEKRAEFFEIYTELDDIQFDGAFTNVTDRINGESGNILKKQYRAFSESNVINAKCVQIFYNDSK